MSGGNPDGKREPSSNLRWKNLDVREVGRVLLVSELKKWHTDCTLIWIQIPKSCNAVKSQVSWRFGGSGPACNMLCTTPQGGSEVSQPWRFHWHWESTPARLSGPWTNSVSPPSPSALRLLPLPLRSAVHCLTSFDCVVCCLTLNLLCLQTSSCELSAGAPRPSPPPTHPLTLSLVDYPAIND
jgi:hypothetical protein